MTPSRLTNPMVERIPKRARWDDGPRMELPVSLPSPTRPKLAATPDAVPPLDPAGTRSRAYALAVVPYDELTVWRGLNAHSAMFVLASTIAPASRMRRTTKASSGGMAVLQGDGAAGRGEVVGVVVVLHEHRNAEERARLLDRRAGPRSRRVGRARAAGFTDRDGVHPAGVVVGRDAIQVRLHHLPAGRAPRAYGLLDLGDRRLHHVHGLGPGCTGRHDGEDPDGDE